MNVPTQQGNRQTTVQTWEGGRASCRRDDPRGGPSNGVLNIVGAVGHAGAPDFDCKAPGLRALAEGFGACHITRMLHAAVGHGRTAPHRPGGGHRPHTTHSDAGRGAAEVLRGPRLRGCARCARAGGGTADTTTVRLRDPIITQTRGSRRIKVARPDEGAAIRQRRATPPPPLPARTRRTPRRRSPP